MSQNNNAKTSTRTTEHRRRRLFAVLAVSISAAALALVAMSGIGENLVYYWSPTELRQAGDDATGATIRLGGLVAPGSVVRSEDGLTLAFDVTDGTETVHIVTKSVPPAMFRENIGVVVEGTMSSQGRFETQRLMVKHDNEYRAPDDYDDRDMKALMESLQFEATPGAASAGKPQTAD